MKIGRIYSVFLRYFYTLKSVQQLADLIYWPLIDIVTWGFISKWIQQESNESNMLAIFMTALIFWQIVWRASLGISYCAIQEQWDRNLTNLFSTPLKLSEWILATLLIALFKLSISLSFSIAAIYLIYDMNLLAMGWHFLLSAGLLFPFGWSVGFISAGAIVRWGQKVDAFAWTFPFIFAPFSAVFYPVEVMPYWAAQVAWMLPTTYVFEGMRELFSSGRFPHSYYLLGLALNSLFLTASSLYFYFMFRLSLEKGLGKMG